MINFLDGAGNMGGVQLYPGSLTNVRHPAGTLQPEPGNGIKQFLVKVREKRDIFSGTPGRYPAGFFPVPGKSKISL